MFSLLNDFQMEEIINPHEKGNQFLAYLYRELSFIFIRRSVFFYYQEFFF